MGAHLRLWLLLLGRALCGGRLRLGRALCAGSGRRSARPLDTDFACPRRRAARAAGDRVLVKRGLLRWCGEGVHLDCEPRGLCAPLHVVCCNCENVRGLLLRVCDGIPSL